MATTEPVPLSVYDAAVKYLQRRQLKEITEQLLKDYNKEFEVVEQELSDLMIELNLQKFSHDGATLYLSTKLHANALAAKRTDLRTYLLGEGRRDILLDTVDDKALTKYVKGLLEETVELPEGLAECINVFEKPTVCVRQQKSKGDINDDSSC